MLKNENEKKNIWKRVLSKHGTDNLNLSPFLTILYYSQGMGFCMFLVFTEAALEVERNKIK